MQKITPFLWFDDQAEEAANFYVSIFKNSKIETVSRYGDAGPGPKGSVMIVQFQLEGQRFTALNGGPIFTSRRRSHCSSIVRHRKKSMTSGKNSPRAASRTVAAG